MKKFTVNEKTTLKTFTDNTYPQGSFLFNALLKRRDIRVNGVKMDKNVPLSEGDEVTYYTTAAEESKTAFTEIYRDENIVVCDKESGVNSEAVFYTLSQSEECYFIHRLDRNTAGLIVFALNKAAEEDLLNQFKTHTLKKEYSALVFGRPTKNEDTVTLYLTKDERAAKVKVSAKKGDGQIAKTYYKTLKSEGDFSLLSIKLLTGRTHQIRATFAHLGCPVAGDEKYGDEKLNKKYSLSRQCLISRSLTFNSSGLLSYLNGKTFLSEKAFRIFPFKNS